jgi:ABC-type dipeptide/oligopeptide/nickel transport system ATPase subunit
MRVKEIKNELTEDLIPLDSQVKHSTEPIPASGSQSWLIIGKKGTGKSTLLLRTLISKKSPWCANKSFDSVYLCSQSAEKDPKFEDMVDELKSQGRFFNTFNEEILDEIIQNIDEFNEQYKQDMIEYKEKGYYTRVIGKDRKGKDITKKVMKERFLPRHLLVLDDVINLLPKSTQNSRINDLFCNQRHKKLCTITVSQVFNKLNPIIRRNADMMSLFHTDNKTEYDAMLNDLSVNPDEFKTLYDYATDDMNSFLHIQMTGARPLYFKKFNRIMLE